MTKMNLHYQEKEEWVHPDPVSEELEKEAIAKYKKCNSECTHCVHTDSPCTPDDYDKNEIGYCSEYESIYTAIKTLKQENAVLKKALDLYVEWADECGVAWDNFPDMTEKWYKVIEEKGLGWIDGLIFMVMQEAKEQLTKECE